MNIRTLLCLAAVALVPGCAAFKAQDAPGSTRLETEPDSRGRYWVYVPSTHSLAEDTYGWPLVIACHSTFPLNSAEAQVREWRALAERGQFVVIAPVLSASAFPVPGVQDQVRRQVEDERLILAIVERAIRQYQVDPNKVYIAGYGTGNYDALWVGLRNPRTFRAIFCGTGNFDANLVNQPMLLDRLDPYQPVRVIFAEKDPAGAEGQKNAAWLREKDWHTLIVTPLVGGNKPHSGMAWEFFASIPRHYPLLRPVVTPERNQPRGRTLKVYADSPLEAVYWKLGDGTESREKSFSHTFANPGVYDCLLVARPEKGSAVQRKFQIRVEK